MADPIIQKRCTTCQKLKPATAQHFYRNKNKPDGLSCQCQNCVNNYMRTEHGKNTYRAYRNRKREHLNKYAKERYALQRDTPHRKLLTRKTKLRTKYGLSLADYDAMLATQGDACAICRTTEPNGRWGRFHVDHNHQTGKVRGLLCHGCNRALGMWKDSPEIFQRAADYLHVL